MLCPRTLILVSLLEPLVEQLLESQSKVCGQHLIYLSGMVAT